MSMDRCVICDRYVDTDDFAAYVDDDCICERCQDEHCAACEECEETFRIPDEADENSPNLKLCKKHRTKIPPGDPS